MTFEPTIAEHRATLREIAEAAKRMQPGAWHLQTSNSFRRIGSEKTRGDGDVICAIMAPSDGQPDLLAKPGVLEYVATMNPTRAIALLDHVESLEKQLANAHSAIEMLRAKIDHHDAVFQVALELAGMTSA